MDEIIIMLRTRDISKPDMAEYECIPNLQLVVIDGIMMIDNARSETNAFFHFINALHELKLNGESFRLKKKKDNLHINQLNQLILPSENLSLSGYF